MRKTTLMITGAAAIAAALLGSAPAQAQRPAGSGGSIERVRDDGAKGGRSAPAVQRLMVNGKPVRVDVAPQAINGTMMVPIRFVSEYLGGDVLWEPGTRKVRARNGDQRITLSIGSTQAYWGSEGRALSQAPVIRDGRTLLPLRDIARFFNAEVTYNQSARTVFLSVPETRVPAASSNGNGSTVQR